MTPTEDRLRAVLAETAGAVREDTLRPLIVPGRRRRRWPRVATPIAAAAAVVAVLVAEVAVGQMAGPPKAAGRTAGAAPTAGKSARGMAYDAANGTIYVALTRYSFPRGGRLRHGNGPRVHGEPDSLAMISAAACNASNTGGCAQVSYAPTGGRGAAAVAVDERTHTAYVLNSGSDTVAVINTATCNAATTSGCAQNPARVRIPYAGNGLAVNPQTDTIYVAESSQTKPPMIQAEMSVINGAACNASDTGGCAGPPAATVTLGTGRFLSPEITVDPGTDTVYAAGAGLAVYNGRTCTGTDTQGCTVPLARIHPLISGFAPSIAVDAPAGTIYASTALVQADGGVVVAISRNTCNALDTTGCTRLATIRGGPGPTGVAADPQTHTLYVANEPSAVSMVNTATCNATSVSSCSQFPAAFPVGSYPGQIVVSPAAHTVYVLNVQAGNVSVINSATCNATDTRGCPAKSPAGTPRAAPYSCGPIVSAYEAGEPAGPPARTSVRVASGAAGRQAWSLWAKKGVADPYGIELGGLVLNGRWYPLCSHGLSPGPDGNLQLVDAGARGIVYGYIQHPTKVTIRLGNHHPRWTPESVLLAGTTFFIFQLPRSACAYRGLAVNAWQGKHWGGYSNASYGTCLPGQIVNVAVGRSSWGPDYQGQHW
jgi:YVTN family beta-propeller protein